MKWPVVKLNEICRPKQWPTISGSDLTDSGYPVYGANGKIGFYSAYNHEEPTVLITCRGATCGSINVSEPQAYVTGNAMALDKLSSLMDRSFLAHFLRNRRLDDVISGTAQPQITREGLTNLTVPQPPVLEQRRIAAILDQAEALRAKRRQALAKLDTLTQSLFLEMFGDPNRNPKSWLRATLGDVIHYASDGPHMSPKYVEAGVPFLSTRHIRAGKINREDLKFLTLADAETQWKKCKPQRGDILYTKGGTTGMAAVVDFDDPIAVWVHVALLRPKSELVDPFWLACMLNSSFCYVQSQRFTHGIANRDLGLKRMTKIKLYIPPMQKQLLFVQIAGNLSSMAARASVQLVEVERLMQSLQHRAFRGEL